MGKSVKMLLLIWAGGLVFTVGFTVIAARSFYKGKRV
jgi:hypothetical protein